METVAASASAADTLACSGWVVAGFCVLGACAASDLPIGGKILLAAKVSQAFTSVAELDALRKQEKQEWPFAQVSGTVQELVTSGNCTGSLRLVETFPNCFRSSHLA